MLTKKLLPLLTALALTTIVSTASANVISFGTPAQEVGVGATVTFDINMDFINSTVGGAFDVFYDANVLAYVSFEFNATFLATVADPDFAIMPDNCFSDGSAISGCSVGDAELNGIGFGHFDGLSGQHTIGTLTFTALQIGVAAITMANNDSPWEGFFSADDATELLVLYGPAKVHVVPVPAAVWLMISGLGLLAGVKRRRS